MLLKGSLITGERLNGIQEVSGSIPLSSTPRRKVFHEEKRGVKSSLFYYF
jgi:hypothetical protein